MPWFRVDDGFALHPKVLAAGNAAVGLWVRAGSWSAQQLTEGFVPAAAVGVLGGRPRDSDALLSAGLWDRVDGGFRFHQWEERQPTKEQVESDRDAARERQRRARERARSRRDEPGAQNERHSVTHAQVTPLVTVPPARPGPTHTKTKPQPPAAASAEPTRVDPSSAQTLVGEWIDHCQDRPPGRVIGQVAKELATMLAENIPTGDVRAGLRVWHDKRLHPSSLASVVHEVRQGPRRSASTTDDRVAQGLALAQRFADDEQRAIGGQP